jgi:hypothetical protein
MNPVVRLRRGFLLSRRDFAVQLGCSLATLYSVETGRVSGLGPVMRRGLGEIGEDSVALDAEYRLWRAEQRTPLG